MLGKLLVAFGPDHVLWGTDSIWYGSPQDQIQAFRAFEISPELQERFGYPALTPAVKERILGGNAAELYGVTVPAATCRDGGDGSRHDNRTLGPVRRRERRGHVPARASVDRRRTAVRIRRPVGARL